MGSANSRQTDTAGYGTANKTLFMPNVVCIANNQDTYITAYILLRWLVWRLVIDHDMNDNAIWVQTAINSQYWTTDLGSVRYETP